MGAKLNHALRVFVVVFLPAALFIIAGSFLFVTIQTRLIHAQLIDQEELALSGAAQELEKRLTDAAADVFYLQQMPRLGRSLQSATPDNLAALADNWTAYVDANRSIDQIRWLDLTGRERLRINTRDGKAQRVAEAELQNKADRPYFSLTMTLPQGKVYLSPLDLNIEQGQIELPHKPMLRLATPLFDGAGRRQGVLVINYLASKWLDVMVKGCGDHASHIFLANRDGSWLRGPQHEDEFGSQLGKPTGLPQQYPAAWQALQQADRGVAWLADGLWVWRSLQPLQPTRQELFQIRPSDATTSIGLRDYTWHLVARVPAEQVAAATRNIHRTAWVTGDLLLLTALGPVHNQ